MSKSYVARVVMACGLLLPLSAGFADAAGSTDKTVISTDTVYEERKGRTVEFGVYITGTEEIAGGTLQLDYDQTKLTNVKAELGDGVNGFVPALNAETAGTVALSWAKAEGDVQSGTLMKLSGKVVNGNEAINLDLTGVQLFDESGERVEANVFDGVIKPFDGKSQQHANKVKGDRDWKITFSSDIHPATVNTRTVKIVNSRGYEQDITVTIQSKRTLVVKPKAALSRGTYTILITEQVHSANGQPLKSPIQFEYTVE